MHTYNTRETYASVISLAFWFSFEHSIPPEDVPLKEYCHCDNSK